MSDEDRVLSVTDRERYTTIAVSRDRAQATAQAIERRLQGARAAYRMVIGQRRALNLRLAAVRAKQFTVANLARQNGGGTRGAVDAAEINRRELWAQYRRILGELQPVKAALAAARSACEALERDMRQASALAEEVRDQLQRSARAADREWRRAHPDACGDDYRRYLEAMAAACRLSLRDLLRLVGQPVGPRTPDELEEDFRRYLAGVSMRQIARDRGIDVVAVIKHIRRRLGRDQASALEAQMAVGEDPLEAVSRIASSDARYH